MGYRRPRTPAPTARQTHRRGRRRPTHAPRAYPGPMRPPPAWAHAGRAPSGAIAPPPVRFCFLFHFFFFMRHNHRPRGADAMPRPHDFRSGHREPCGLPVPAGLPLPLCARGSAAARAEHYDDHRSAQRASAPRRRDPRRRAPRVGHIPHLVVIFSRPHRHVSGLHGLHVVEFLGCLHQRY